MASRHRPSRDPWTYEARIAWAEQELLRQRASATCYVKRWSQRAGADTGTYRDMLEALGLRPYLSAKQKKNKG